MNSFACESLERGIDPMVYRYFCLTAHYRTQMSFSWKAWKLMQRRNGWYKTAFEWGEPGEVIEAVKQAVTVR